MHTWGKVLKPGDSVWWNDPDEGACSGILKIQAIDFDADSVRITTPTGRVVEAYEWELEEMEG